MSVYVDDMRARYGRMVMCHMVADTREELYVMAVLIGVGRKWVQNPGTPAEHFDICLSKRAKAIECGAIEVTKRQLVEMLQQKRGSR